jgi:pectate lyase
MPYLGRSAAVTLLLFTAYVGSASAETLEVGPNAKFTKPSEAIAAAKDGDVINIASGEYFDCAMVNQNVLTIQGSGPGTVITDKPCGGKALLVEHGDKIIIRNLTLQRARVPDGNGAGIRYEGGNLTVDNVKFINNQDGILGNDVPNGTVRISNSEFLQNGVCERACSHGVYFGHMALVHIERSRFFETKQGHHIKSRAARTEVIGCDISDGENGNSSYLIDISNGGSLIVRDSRMQKGPKSDNHAYAISIGAEGVEQPTRQILIEHNTFTNDLPMQTTFVRNLTATPAELVSNVFKGKVRPIEGDGSIK